LKEGIIKKPRTLGENLAFYQTYIFFIFIFYSLGILSIQANWTRSISFAKNHLYTIGLVSCLASEALSVAASEYVYNNT